MTLKPGWRVREFLCGHCGGAGVKWDYRYESPRDCCCNGGIQYIGPGGRLFAYPGGPFLGGSASFMEIANSQPLMEEEP